MTVGWQGNAYIEASRAATTRETYRTFWRAWERWCAVHERQSLPTVPDVLAAYVIERADVGDRVSTIRGRIAAICWYHADHGHEKPRDGNLQRLVAGIARTQAGETPAQVAGLTAECMRRIEGSANLKRPIERQNLALCWVMRDGLLRRSEAAALEWDDIERNPDGTGLLLIRRSKTDQMGTGHVTFLSRATMQALTRIRPEPAAGKVFPFHPRTIERRIQATARRAGLPGRFRGHSPRVGMSLDLAESGASLVELQQVGRWKSANMPAHYIRRQDAQRSAVARFYQERRAS